MSSSPGFCPCCARWDTTKVSKTKRGNKYQCKRCGCRFKADPKSQYRGENLIFLISQPRSGSTMSQRILGKHSNIHTLSEPWLMLPPLYPLSFDSPTDGYDTRLGKIGWQSFFQQLSDKEDVYYQGLRHMYSYIYGMALRSAQKKYFLDKTPRYYYIIPELLKTFPSAKFIVLLRNPLAVLCSIINTWVNRDWSRLNSLRLDITEAPQLLLEGIEVLKGQCTVLHYENIIDDPEREFRATCEDIGLKYEASIINYSEPDGLTPWRFGDQTLIYERDQPEVQNSDKWISSLKTPQIWQVAYDYLNFLGTDTLGKMGYSYDILSETLDTHRPSRESLNDVIRFEWLLRKTS